jgi:hypothetical protein
MQVRIRHEHRLRVERTMRDAAGVRVEPDGSVREDRGAHTEYHFRVVTKNAGGTVEGPDVTFKTLKVAAPAVETKAASAVGQTTATLNASVNPRGGALSTCKFEYGTTTGYGSSAPCATLPGSGSSPVAVSALIAAGLVANTEYHFRISATNTAGTSKGADVTFKTP